MIYNVCLGKLKFSYRYTKYIGHDDFISLVYHKFPCQVLVFYVVFSNSKPWFIARVTSQKVDTCPPSNISPLTDPHWFGYSLESFWFANT